MSGMRLIVKTVTRLTSAIIFLFGFYIALSGHLTMGGGFAGGIIIALCYVLNVLAFGRTKEEQKQSRQGTMVVMCLGLTLFLVVALLGFLRGSFLANFLPLGTSGDLLSAGVIPLFNLALMIEVGAGLYLAFLRLISIEVVVTEEEEEEGEQ